LSVLTILALLVTFSGLLFLLNKVSQLSSLLKGEEILQRIEHQRGELGANLKSLDERLHFIATEVGGVREVTGQLRDFQASLKSQKLRGNVGELVLEDLLHQVLPSSSYETQFTFKGGRRVDALIKTRQGSIPIDAKFPIEGFQRWTGADEAGKEAAWREFLRGVRKQMDETAQYILPVEGTIPFALMYIPFEPIFQEIVSDKELMRYSLEKKVFFASPQTFLVMVKVIQLGLQREHFANQAVEILQVLHSVSRDAEEFEALLKRAAAQLADSKSNLDRLLSSFSTLLAKLESLKDIDAKPKS
ncbi:MAG: DNA recombination protein RmuC, partial [Patescibacteria group bacterium]